MTKTGWEDRYLVLKRKDILNSLTDLERHLLHRIAFKVHEYRTGTVGKKPLHCVVVERDWPEYESTWAAILRRMASESAAKNSHALCTYCGIPFDLPPGPQPVPPIICGANECREKRASKLRQVG